MNLTFPSQEKSFSSIDSLGMIDHSNLNDQYEQDTLNAAYEDVDSFIENSSFTQRQVKYKTSCVEQVQAFGSF